MSDIPNRHLLPRWWPHPNLRTYIEDGGHEGEGATQPWIQNFLYHLARMLDARHIVELGTWRGATSAWLACALADNGGGTLTLVDNNADNLTVSAWRANALGHASVTVVPVQLPSFEFLASLDPDVTLIFLDDDKLAVPEKIAAIRARLSKGVIVIHDAEMVQEPIWNARGAIMRVPSAWAGGDVAVVPIP